MLQTASKSRLLGLRVSRGRTRGRARSPAPARPTRRCLVPEGVRKRETAVIFSVSIKFHFARQGAGGRPWTLKSPRSRLLPVLPLTNPASLTLGDSVSPSVQRAHATPSTPGRLSQKETNSAGRGHFLALPSLSRLPRRPGGRPPKPAPSRPPPQRPPPGPTPCRPLTGRHGDSEPHSPPCRGSAGTRRAR